jgi:hypothetical protein
MLMLTSMQGKAVYQNAVSYFVILRSIPFTYSHYQPRNMNLNHNESDIDNDGAGFAGSSSRRKQELDLY